MKNIYLVENKVVANEVESQALKVVVGMRSPVVRSNGSAVSLRKVLEENFSHGVVDVFEQQRTNPLSEGGRTLDVGLGMDGLQEPKEE